MKNVILLIVLVYCSSASANLGSGNEPNSSPKFDADYDKVLGQWFMQNQMAALDKCVKENHAEAIAPFDGFIQVEPSGLIIQYHVEVKNPFSLCLKSALEGEQAPKPPQGIQLNPFDWGGLEEV